MVLFSFQLSGTTLVLQSVRIESGTLNSAKSVARERGMTLSALLRDALRKEVASECKAQELQELEDRLSATITQVSRDIAHQYQATQSVLAILDQLVRVFLTRVPEPPSEITEIAKANGKAGYERFMSSVTRRFCESNGSVNGKSKREGKSD